MRDPFEMLALMRGTVGLSIENFSPAERAAFFSDIVADCPFCDGRPIYGRRHGSYTVRCSKCGAMGPRDRIFIRAVIRWNRRA